MTSHRIDPLAENETRMTAALPNLDIEIRHRDEGDAGELVTIQMRAQPDMETALRSWLPLMPFAMAGLSPVMAMNPFAAWMQLTRMSWQPFLQSLPRNGDRPES